ncbi:hypothetical protein JW916_06270 [Candidatus Sumerlaeota bacterium]|nr:hypothetical protein [Candidatus Sumerlaeota bacterium]
MIGRAFLNGVTHSEEDIVQLLLSVLEETQAAYCLIGGLAVNAYAEPVVSLDVDLVVVADRIDALCAAALAKGMKAETFEHSMNLSASTSDLRIQVQTDPRYQEFLARAEPREVLGYRMVVAGLRDVLRGKLWAYADESRRPSKRQKDLSDILRLAETHPELKDELPPAISRQMA